MRIGPVAVLAALLLVGCGGSSESEGAGAIPPSAMPSLPAEAAGIAPQGPTIDGVVDRVVDGDTLHVRVGGEDLTVRMIGINTPETVKPDSPVECFGPEASDFAKGVLTGQPVTLEFDGGQGQEDRFGRTLAYVWHTSAAGEPVLFNLEAVAGGYAFERQYGPTPPVWRPVLRAAQDAARAGSLGLWGACPQS